MKKQRMIYLACFLIILAIEVYIAMFVHDQFIRPYLGDVLVVFVLYFFIRLFLPVGVTRLPFYIFLFAAGVEVLQYFDILKRTGLETSAFSVFY